MPIVVALSVASDVSALGESDGRAGGGQQRGQQCGDADGDQPAEEVRAPLKAAELVSLALQDVLALRARTIGAGFGLGDGAVLGLIGGHQLSAMGKNGARLEPATESEDMKSLSKRKTEVRAARHRCASRTRGEAALTGPCPPVERMKREQRLI